MRMVGLFSLDIHNTVKMVSSSMHQLNVVDIQFAEQQVFYLVYWYHWYPEPDALGVKRYIGTHKSAAA